MPRWLRTLAWWTLVVGVFLFPYSAEAHRYCAPFAFPGATVALLFLFWRRWKREVLARAGIPRRARTWLGVLLVVCLLAICADRLAAHTVVAHGGLVLEPFPPGVRAGFLFQTLNEEVLLGFLPLWVLTRRFRLPLAMALGVAAVFAALHVLLYRGGELQTWIRWETAVVLFAAGALRNALILLAGHIGFAWALHAAWNLTMFAGRWRDGADGEVLGEPAVFDRFLGHPLVAAVAGAAALAALWALRRRGVRW